MIVLKKETMKIPSLIRKHISLLFADDYDIYLLGGFIRDIYYSNINNSNLKFNDIDIVLDKGSNVFPVSTRVNRFGGNTYYKNKVRYDFWHINNAYAIKKFNLPASIENVILTTVFNINSIAINVRTGKIYENDFFKSFYDKKLKFNNTTYLVDFPEIQTLRAFVYSKKLNLKISDDIKDFMYDTLSRNTIYTFRKKIDNHKYNSFQIIHSMYCSFFRNSKKIHIKY